MNFILLNLNEKIAIIFAISLVIIVNMAPSRPNYRRLINLNEIMRSRNKNQILLATPLIYESCTAYLFIILHPHNKLPKGVSQFILPINLIFLSVFDPTPAHDGCFFLLKIKGPIIWMIIIINILH